MTDAIVATIDQYLSERGLVMRQGTVVNATIIHALSSTKKLDKQCDPQTSKA